MPVSSQRPVIEKVIQFFLQSGITAVNLTVSGRDFASSVRNIAGWMDRIERLPDAFMQIRTVADLSVAKETGKLGIVYGFQDTTPFEGSLDAIPTFLGLGVKVTQLTYNVRNLVGDGCLEPANGGLSVITS